MLWNYQRHIWNELLYNKFENLICQHKTLSATHHISKVQSCPCHILMLGGLTLELCDIKDFLKTQSRSERRTERLPTKRESLGLKFCFNLPFYRFVFSLLELSRSGMKIVKIKMQSYTVKHTLKGKGCPTSRVSNISWCPFQTQSDCCCSHRAAIQRTHKPQSGC